jgi:hypothetical protein
LCARTASSPLVKSNSNVALESCPLSPNKRKFLDFIAFSFGAASASPSVGINPEKSSIIFLISGFRKILFSDTSVGLS